MTIGERIALRRKQLGLTQFELAQKMGYKSKSSINKIELGITDVAQKNIVKLAQALETEPTWLMGWEEKEQDAPAADSEFNKELLFSWIDSMSREELIETLQVVTNKLSEK